jgi:hypothetical protein
VLLQRAKYVKYNYAASFYIWSNFFFYLANSVSSVMAIAFFPFFKKGGRNVSRYFAFHLLENWQLYSTILIATSNGLGMSIEQ